MRLLRALRAHVEPLFFLYDGALSGPGGPPLVEVELEGVASRLWRVEGDPPRALAEAQLVIADGHHRYETALAFHEQDGTEESAWLLAVVVPTDQDGVTIFPTHRLVDEVDVSGAEASDEPPLELLRRGEGPVVYRAQLRASGQRRDHRCGGDRAADLGAGPLHAPCGRGRGAGRSR